MGAVGVSGKLLRAAFMVGVTALAQMPTGLAAQDLLPERRSVLLADTDLPGSDLRSLFGTTLQACEKACLTDTACVAFTYNARNGSCFPKSEVGAPASYERAISGHVVTTTAAEQRTASARAEELGFLSADLRREALQLSEGMALSHISDPAPLEDLRHLAFEAEQNGQRERAAEIWGAVAHRSGQSFDWENFSRATLMQAGSNSGSGLHRRAILAAINAYLRADGAPEQHTILSLMASAFEAGGSGRDALRALRLAQKLQHRDDTGTEVERLAGLYGFRIEGHEVNSDLASPQICARFTEGLAESGVDYTPFVQLPEAGMTVEVSGWNQLCVAGLRHGQRAAVTFREGLPSADGQRLEKSATITAYVRDRAPQVYFPSGGYVLPATGPVALPVTSVNTTELDLGLYRISDRSILRSLQQNWFSRPMDSWDAERFQRDIGEKIWSGHATVAQDANRDVTTRLPMTEALKGQGAGLYAIKAQLSNRSEDDYENQPAWQWFMVSDLGISSFSGIDGLTVVVRSLNDAGPKAGAKVEVIARSNRVMASALTDQDGIARFDAQAVAGTGAGQAALITVSAGSDAEAPQDFAMLSLTDPEFDLSDRGVEGRAPSPPIDLFLATDRGAYRAGETLHATALARNGEGRALTGLPLTALLRRPDGVEHLRQRITDVAGGFAIALPLAGSSPRGAWKLEVYADPEAPALAVQSFLVEDFLPERIDFTLALPEGDIALDRPVEIGVEARYLFGAAGAGLTGEGETVIRAASALAAYPGYVFGPADEPFAPQMESFTDSLVTDDAGKAALRVTLPEIDAKGRPLEAEFRLRLAEGSGRPVERRILRAIAPATPLIGLKPAFEDAVPEGSEASFAAVAVGPETLPVTWRVERIETRYQWYQLDGSWNWEPMTNRTKVAEGTATLGASAQNIAAKVDWGQYELTVASADGRVRSSVKFTAGWYAAADTRTSPDMLELSLDKAHYAPGETARLRIVPRAAGQALISVLSNRVVAMKIVEVAQGETVIELPVTEDWGAGVYLTATVLRPMDSGAARLPTRALGLAHAAIAPGDRQLTAQIIAPAESEPRAPLEIAVKVEGVKAGETAFVTLAAIDVGILNLTGHKAPDPSAHYFGQRKLGVGIRDLYGRLIDGMNGAEGQVRSGGDAGRAGMQAPPPTEELVAWFDGPIEVDGDGMARASVPLPSFNGTVKVMAVAWSQSGVGQAQADVLVRDPVVVTASLPRYLQPGDTSRLLLEIVHATGAAGRMGLDVTATGVTLGDIPSGVDLAPQGKVTLDIPVTAPSQIALGEVAEVEVTLTTSDGKVLSKPLRLPLQNSDPTVQRQSLVELAAGQTLTLGPEIFAEFRTGGAEALISAGGFARLNAPGLLAALDAYPWGCSEQLTSRAMPLLALSDMATALSRPEALDVKARIDQTIEQLLLKQDSEGAFGLWSPWSNGEQWLTAYVTDFLSQARAQGHAVPDRAFRGALDNLRSTVNYAGDFNEGGEALAYALMVLAREGAASVGDLRYYADVKAESFSSPLSLAQLAAGLAFYGDQRRADALFARASEKALAQQRRPEAQLYRADFGSHLRDSAGVLALALDAGSTAIDREALTAHLAQNVGRAALSTQEQAWILLAARGLSGVSGEAALTFDGAPARQYRLDAAAPPVTVENRSKAPVSIGIAAFGKPEGRTDETADGYRITRRYFTLEGVEADVASVRSGTRLVAVLDVTPLQSGEGRLMVEDPLPAGFEIDNPNLMRAGQISALDWLSPVENVERSEFRQDRFMTALDWRGSDSFQLAYILRAVSPGTFHHPAASVEDMYRPMLRATTASGQVVVTE